MSFILVQTQTSFLSSQFFTDNALLDQCVTEVKDKLLHKPEITVYGKIAHQHRNIGFFSDTSNGYWYSG